MSNTFYGRETEITWLRGMFDAVATKGPDGKFTGPRMAFVIAESGIGKSRLVQELYLRLTSDAQWDPPEVDYWPEAFLEVGAQLRSQMKSDAISSASRCANLCCHRSRIGLTRLMSQQYAPCISR